jgi:hypothetical protein
MTVGRKQTSPPTERSLRVATGNRQAYFLVKVYIVINIYTVFLLLLARYHNCGLFPIAVQIIIDIVVASLREASEVK